MAASRFVLTVFLLSPAAHQNATEITRVTAAHHDPIVFGPKKATFFRQFLDYVPASDPRGAPGAGPRWAPNPRKKIFPGGSGEIAHHQGE
jgi:hypothetical protein